MDHVESLSRNNFSVIYVWLKWGTNLNAAQTLVQSQAGFAMAAVPKSLGVLPPFVLQYDPSNAPVCQVVVTGTGFTGPQLYDYAFNNIEPLLEGISGVASAAPDGGRMRQINVVVDPVKAQARQLTTQQVAAAAALSNALLPSGEFIAPRFDANVYTNAIPRRVRTIGDAEVKVLGNKAVRIKDVARVEDGGTAGNRMRSPLTGTTLSISVLRMPEDAASIAFRNALLHLWRAAALGQELHVSGSVLRVDERGPRFAHSAEDPRASVAHGPNRAASGPDATSWRARGAWIPPRREWHPARGRASRSNPRDQSWLRDSGSPPSAPSSPARGSTAARAGDDDSSRRALRTPFASMAAAGGRTPSVGEGEGMTAAFLGGAAEGGGVLRPVPQKAEAFSGTAYKGGGWVETRAEGGDATVEASAPGHRPAS